MVVGAHVSSSARGEAEGRQEIRAASRYPHEDYNPMTLQNDMMLIKLQAGRTNITVVFSEHAGNIFFHVITFLVGECT